MSGFALSAGRPSNIILAFLPLIIAFVVYLGAYLIMSPSTAGDEPHYLLYAYSLVHDHDIDLRNNYEEGDVGRFFARSEIDPHAFDYRGNGKWISKRNIGLPILIAPAIFLHESAESARVLFIVISALLAYQIFRLLQDSNIAGPRFLWPVWAAVVFSLPLLAFSNQIYPEIPAALLLVYGARVVLAKGSSRRDLFFAALAAAALPWLHVRFLVFTAGLGLGIAYRLLDGQISWSGLKASWPRLLLLAPIPISLLVTAVAFTSWYGSPLPGPLHHVPGERAVWWTWSRLYTRGLGFFLSPEFGWLPHAPVHWLGIVGLVVLARVYRMGAGVALVFAGGYIILVSPGMGGFSFPARFMVCLVPFVGIPLLLILKASRPARVLFVGLLGLSLTMSGIAVDNHWDLYPTVPGRTTLPLARDLQDAWPTLEKGPTGFRVFSEKTPRQVGELVAGSEDDASEASRVAYASPVSDPAGFLSYGPFKKLRAGTYVARFNIAARGDQPTDHIATLDVFAQPRGEVLATKELRLLDLPAGGEYSTVEVPFFTPDVSYSLETRVYYTGKAEVWLKSIAVVAISQPSGLAEDLPSWPKSLLWVGGTALLAFLLPWRGQSLRPTVWGSPPEKREPR